MIENNNLFEDTTIYNHDETDDHPDDENSMDPEEDLNQMMQDYNDKQMVAKQPKQVSASDGPKTEAELIGEIQDLNRKMNLSGILAYWQMGTKINCFYQGKYGSAELRKIADQTGVGQDSLTKACKFARNYSEEQLQVLLQGDFHLSWFQIAQNLSVEPQKLIGVYQEVRNPSEFHNGIMKLKDPKENRGKTKKPESQCMPVNDEAKKAAGPPVSHETEDQDEIRDDAYYDNIRPPLSGDVFDVMDEPEEPGPDPDYESYRQELDSLREENEVLKKKLLRNEENYNQLEDNLNKYSQELDRMQEIANKYHEILDKAFELFEAEASPQQIFNFFHSTEIAPYLKGSVLRF